MIPGILAGAMGSGGGPPISNPVRLSLTKSFAASASTVHNVAMPASVTAGDLLIVAIATSTTSAMTTPSGWTLLGTQTNGVRVGVYYKVAAGAEGGTTVNFPTGGGTAFSAECYAYQVGTFTGTPQISAAATGSSTAPNSSNVSPAGGAGDYAWVSLFGGAWNISMVTTAYPFASGQSDNAGAPNAAPQLSSAYENSAGSSKDPGPFTISPTRQWVAWTVAVKGA